MPTPARPTLALFFLVYLGFHFSGALLRLRVGVAVADLAGAPCARRAARPPAARMAGRHAGGVRRRLLAEAVAGEAFQDFVRRQRPYRADLLPVMEHRGGAAVVGARHLPGELVDVARRVAGDEQLGLVAVPGQARHSSPPSASVPSDRDRFDRGCSPWPL